MNLKQRNDKSFGHTGNSYQKTNHDKIENTEKNFSSLMLDFTIWFRQGKSHSSSTYLWNTFTLGLFSTLSFLVFFKTHGNDAGQFYPKHSMEGWISGAKKPHSGLAVPWAGCPWGHKCPEDKGSAQKNISSGCDWALGIWQQHWRWGTISENQCLDKEISVWLSFLCEHGFKSKIKFCF